MWLLWLWRRLLWRGIGASLLLLLLLGAGGLSLGMRAGAHAARAMGLGRGAWGIDQCVGVRLQDLGSGGWRLGLLERRGCELVAGLLGLVREARGARVRRVRVGEWRVRWWGRGVSYDAVQPEGAADAVEGSRVCENRLCMGWVRGAGLRW